MHTTTAESGNNIELRSFTFNKLRDETALVFHSVTKATRSVGSQVVSAFIDNDTTTGIIVQNNENGIMAGFLSRTGISKGQHTISWRVYCDRSDGTITVPTWFRNTLLVEER